MNDFAPGADESLIPVVAGMTILEEARLLARIRGNAKGDRRSERLDPENPDMEDILGAAGEIGFSRATGLPVDWTVRLGGDGGIDFSFRVPMRARPVTIDVKTYRKPIHLLVKAAEMRQCADIIVGAYFDCNQVVGFIGWETKSIMSMMPVHDFGIGPAHFLLADQLQPMSKLFSLLAMRERE